MKKNNILFLLLFLFAGAVGAKAQTGALPNAFRVSGTPTASRVDRDPRIDLLIQKQVYINTLALRNVPGYRVQVISTMDRNKASAAKAQLLQLFPKYKTYLSYQSPYFRVRIGDFRDQQDAQELQQELNSYFPNGVFTVRDYIHISPEQLFETPNNDPDN